MTKISSRVGHLYLMDVLMSEEELTLFSKIGEFVDTVKKARKYDKTPTKVIYQVLYFYLSFSLSILIASFTPF